MTGGYMGKVLWVDLSKGTLNDEMLDEKLCRNFIGGYGIGTRELYSRMKGGVDPLGPENILGFMTGPLTGGPALSGTRYTVLCKSPLTGTWGDANSGGDFGPNLKFAGYDGVFFTGISAKPVYLYIEEGVAELKDAADLWGEDSFETEDILKGVHGEETKVSCIGQSGEGLSLIAAVMNNKGRAAGRSGVGAVMGSKKLKAIAVNGSASIPMANPAAANALRHQYMKTLSGPFADLFRNFGTPGLTAASAHSGDSPVKNWDGVGVRDFSNPSTISDVNVINLQSKKYACYRCPLGCGGHMKKGVEYNYEAGAHKPEYETLAAFGTMCLNTNVESIIMANDICNRYGLDTISAGCTVAFAIECYERGLISKEDTGGLEMTWGNHAAIVAMTEQLARREGFGAVLADGVKVAAEKIGKGAEQYAIHVAGEEVPMHDPKFTYHQATTYRMDATPARHTQGGEGLAPAGLLPEFDAKLFTGRGEAHRRASNMCHVLNSSGMCLFMYIVLPTINYIPEILNAVTGWDTNLDELLKTGERISDLRHAFNLREGKNPLEYQVPPRMLGKPAQAEGPLAGVTIDEDTMVKEYMAAMEWEPGTAKPSRQRLTELGLDDVAKDLWG